MFSADLMRGDADALIEMVEDENLHVVFKQSLSDFITNWNKKEPVRLTRFGRILAKLSWIMMRATPGWRNMPKYLIINEIQEGVVLEAFLATVDKGLRSITDLSIGTDKLEGDLRVVVLGKPIFSEIGVVRLAGRGTAKYLELY